MDPWYEKSQGELEGIGDEGGSKGIKGGLWTLLVVPHVSVFPTAALKSNVGQLFAQLSALPPTHSTTQPHR